MGTTCAAFENGAPHGCRREVIQRRVQFLMDGCVAGSARRRVRRMQTWGKPKTDLLEDDPIKLFKLWIINLSHIMGVGDASGEDLDSHLHNRRKGDRQMRWQSLFSGGKTIVDEDGERGRFGSTEGVRAYCERFSFAWEVEAYWFARGIEEVHA